jgi:kynureninase
VSTAFQNTVDFAKQMDQSDSLNNFRNQFHFPTNENNETSIYFCGNSLGLQPISAKQAIVDELDDWAKWGVEGHFHSRKPWFHYHKFLTDYSAEIAGALPHEVVVMNQLTVNLHLLMFSFYRPTFATDEEGNYKPLRYKILMEAGAFPSDMYLVESQVKFHGLDPKEAIIEVAPRPGEHALRHEDIIQTIETHKNELALVFFSGVQYYTGQVFNIKAIAAKAHEVGALAGFDLAHAVGNIDLQLHEWQVDFAAWCSYKYLNSGPGSVGGAFVHEKYANDTDLPRFAGWWGHNENERFKMLKGFIPEPGAAGWQVSNAPVLSMSVHKASLEIFAKAGMQRIIKKGQQLNAYLEYIVLAACQNNKFLDLNIITPAAPERSCQLSILTGENGKALFDHLTNHGVIADWRNPNVIRMAPVGLYNTFEDLYKLGQILSDF